jgi:RNA polymerase II elongation factor ELL
VADKSELPPAVSGRKALAKGKQSSAFLKATRPKHLVPSLTRSMPTSPSLGANRSPSIHPIHAPTSAPQPQSSQSLKMQALRKPLLHLLAIAPISEHALVKKTRSAPEDCMGLVKKFGRTARSGSGWELSDRWYKELDVWDFPYPSQETRKAAINNAISAFDRLRISREDNLWQTLLPKGERGKGKVLSRLNLHGGPMNTTRAPAIKVHRSEASSGSDEKKSSAEDGRVGRDPSRLTPRASDKAGEGMIRSRSQGNIKKQKISEREVQSKRLLPKHSNKVANSSTNQRSTDRQPAPKPNGKFKSAEFVQDSDEDIEMEDVEHHVESRERNTKSKQGQRHAVDQRTPATNEISSSQSGTQSTRPQPKAASINSHSRTIVQQESKGKPQLVRGVARPKVDGKSPSKQSPLSSSPPMNASDLESDQYNASSSSSSPLMDQRRNLVNGRVGSANSRKRKSDDHSASHANGVNGHVHPRPIKRHRPTPSDGSISTSSPTEDQTLRMAQVFKKHHAKYERLHRELSTSPEPSKEKIKKLMNLHDRLAEWKRQIVRAVIAA